MRVSCWQLHLHARCIYIFAWLFASWVMVEGEGNRICKSSKCLMLAQGCIGLAALRPVFVSLPLESESEAEVEGHV